MIVGKAGAVFGAAVVAVAAMGPAGAPAAARSGLVSLGSVVAASRCTSRYISDYQTQIRNYDQHPPRDNPSALNARLGDIADLLQSLNEEHGVLESVCPDNDKTVLYAQLNATVAWALALQSDIAAKLNVSCPPAAKALPAAMLAQAWLAIAATVNDNNGVVPKALNDVIPKVQTRAAAVGLTLPAYSDTSAYWRDQVAEQAKQAVATCPTPVPPPATPTPSPYPSPPP
jgi:hypothetical protein